MDLSHLDKKYFIDPHIYNCPFCKRNNVSYSLIDTFSFHWGEYKTCYGYIVRCDSDGYEKTSMHLSFQKLIRYDSSSAKSTSSTNEELEKQ